MNEGPLKNGKEDKEDDDLERMMMEAFADEQHSTTEERKNREPESLEPEQSQDDSDELRERVTLNNKLDAMFEELKSLLDDEDSHSKCEANTKFFEFEKNIRSSSKDKQGEVIIEIEKFMDEQRAAAEARKKQEPTEVEKEEDGQEKSEGTSKENREKLKEVVENLEKLENNENKEPNEEVENKDIEKYLTDRSEELVVEAVKLGVVESSFRKIGEKYNKLGWKTKLGVGVALGLGAGGLMTVSVPAAMMFFGGIGLQRVAGAASMFLRYEKSTQDGKWKKEKAMGKAMLYSAVMTGGMLLLAEGAKEGTEWLAHHWPFNHAESVVTTPVATSPEQIVQPLQAPEMPSISVDASAGHGYEYMVKRLWEQLQDKGLDPSKFDVDSDIHKLLTADATSIDKVVHQIAADPQHGFFNADGTSVQINPTDHLSIGADGQVHISNDVISSGSSVYASPGAPVTPEYSPEATNVATEVPAVSPAVETLPAPVSDELTNGFRVGGPRPSVLSGESHSVPFVEPPAHHVESPVQAKPEIAQPTDGIIQHIEEGGNKVSEFTLNDENLKNVTFKIITDSTGESKVVFDGQFFNSQESVNRHLTENWTQEIVHKGHNVSLGRTSVLETARTLEIDERALKYLESNNQGNSEEAKILKNTIKNIIAMTETNYGHVLNDSVGVDGHIHILNSHVPSVESSVPIEHRVHENIIVNHSGFEIATDQPHFYADAGDKNIFVYGGSPTEKMEAIKAYLIQYPDKIVYSADGNGTNRIPFSFVDGKVIIGAPVEKKSLFGLVKSFMKAPDPEEFSKLIK